MRESVVWKYLEPKLPPYIKAERFEVVHPPGMSDVFWTDTRTTISGWIELKYCDPEDRELVRGRIPKMKPEQPMFLRRQAEKGLPCGILMRIGQDRWVLWRAHAEHEWVQHVRSNQALTVFTKQWQNGEFSPIELFRALGCPCDV